MTKLLLSAVLATMLVGCASAPVPAPRQASSSAAWITPEQAVHMAANAAPAGVPGTFAMRVQATGVEGGRSFLNSELDYRDQRNLTVALTARATEQLGRHLGGDPLARLTGKDILVRGDAVRVKIHFFVNGRKTDKYYYQTHVKVTDADQIVVR